MRADLCVAGLCRAKEASISGASGALKDNGGADGTRTRDPRRDRPVF